MYGFTDSHPLRELVIFLTAFAGSIALARVPAVARGQDAALARFVGYLRRRGLFTVDRVDIEQRRLDFLRIILAVLVTYRTTGNALTALFGGDPQTVALTATAWVLSMLLLVGFATPLVGLILMLLINLILDNLTFTSTLSSVVLAMNLMVIVFAPAGRSLSIDALILRRRDGLGRAWERLYGLFGPLTLDRSAVVKSCLLLVHHHADYEG